MELYYCNTHYNTFPPVDINPLLLRKYSNEKILVICARQGMIKRIDNASQVRAETYPKQSVVTCGAWELETKGLVTPQGVNRIRLSEYDVIIVVGRTRIASQFIPQIKKIEQVLCRSLPRHT
jgi:signal recognition particle GTPase